MASAEARAAALLFSCSAAVALLLLARAALLQQPPPQRRPADLLFAALYRLRILPDGRGLLDLATRRNMVLLCHAILLVILMDAGVLGARPGTEQGARSAPAPAPHAAGPVRSVVVWRRQRSSRAAARRDDAPRRLAERHRRPRGPEVAAPWAAPALAGAAITTEPSEELAAAKQIVLVDTAPGSYHLLGGHDQLEHQAPAIATGGSRTGSDRGGGTIGAGEEWNGFAEAAAEEAEGVELADDRMIEEFIEKQWSKMRQESLQLVRASGSQQRSIATCA
ncbi:hypothetical protein PVAP13_9KG391700 [Panicum virgatum]|uniref:Uncharacterized protein n=1 Tax=Panicum virgatum TaxID=38727 RepID=A0A8T0NN01_PANVG|nr:hypothetical protein PVAP13_9KG391700 [Panicum virgatum]